MGCSSTKEKIKHPVSNNNNSHAEEVQTETISKELSAMEDNPGQDKGDNSEVSKKSSEQDVTIDEKEPCQKGFDQFIRVANSLIKPELAAEVSKPEVMRLKLNQALPPTLPLTTLLHSLNNIQDLNLSGNNLGPQPFRTVCLAMCHNTTVMVLNLASNKTDTDCAESIGRMLTDNKTLQYLDVSHNSLGNDFFSRCVGSALKTNTTLRVLRAKSIGSVDMKVLSKAVSENSSLMELDVSSNGLHCKTSLARGLAASLRKPECVLTSVCVSQCNINQEGLHELCSAIKKNSSLTELNISANQIGSMKLVAHFLSAVFNHPSMTTFYMNDAKIDDASVELQDVPESSTESSCLQVLGLNTSHITTKLLEFIEKRFNGKLVNLTEIDLGNNPELRISVMNNLQKITSGENGESSIERLTYGMNNADGLSHEISMSKFPNLKYINLRKAKLHANSFCQLTDFLALPNLDTINVDGIKMAGTATIKDCSACLMTSHVTAISLGSCSLADSDLVPLWDVVKSGAQLQMLKLSANRITNVSMSHLVDALLKHEKHPLSVLDVSNNLIESKGAQSLSKLYTTKGHNSELSSLNISGNSVGKKGMLSLVAIVGKSCPLTTLFLNNQNTCLQENEMREIFYGLAQSIGLTVKMKGGIIEPACSDLPLIADDFFIKLTGLGGEPGMLGSMMHCPAILTDKSANQLLSLSLADAFVIAAILKGHNSGECILSADDWSAIIGAKKDAEVPSWLQLADHRARGVYASNLCGNANLTKVEALFEMDANCLVEEVVLMKDPVSKSNNGIGWILMKDENSVDLAIDFYNRGEAKIFGQVFMVSRIKVKVDDHKSQELEAKVRSDAEARQKARQADDSAHRELIHRNTEESWKRHAYRLAHPAYADGRIW